MSRMCILLRMSRNAAMFAICCGEKLSSVWFSIVIKKIIASHDRFARHANLPRASNFHPDGERPIAVHAVMRQRRGLLPRTVLGDAKKGGVVRDVPEVPNVPTNCRATMT